MKKIQEIDNFIYSISLERIKREIEYKFQLICSKDGLRQLTEKLNLLEAKKASIEGILKLQSANQISLNSTVTAKLIQPCSLTLEPVVTNVSKKVLRTFSIGSNRNTYARKSVLELTEKSFDSLNSYTQNHLLVLRYICKITHLIDLQVSQLYEG